MDNKAYTISSFIVNNRKRLFLISLVCLLSFTFFISTPDINGELSGFDIEKSNYFTAQNKMQNAFNIKDIIEIKIEPTKNSKIVFNGLDSLAKNIKTIFPNCRVKSLNSVRSIFKNEIEQNFHIDSILKKSSTIPVIDNLISKDKKSFLVLTLLDSNTIFNLNTFDSVLDLNYKGFLKVNAFSRFHVENQVTKTLNNDLIKLTLSIFFIFLIIIFFAFGTIESVIFIAIVLIFSLIPSLALFNIFDVNINLITILSIPVVLVLSLSDSIHLLSGYYSGKKINNTTIIISSFKKYLIPSFLTSLTTAIAFLSFVINDNKNLSQFGLITFVSVITSFIFTHSISAFILSKFKHKGVKRNFISGFLDYILKRKVKVSIILIIITLMAIPATLTLNFKTDFDSFIPLNSKVREVRKEFIEDFDSPLTISILLDSPIKRSFKIDSNVIHLAKIIKKIPNISNVKSIDDQLNYLNKYFFLNNLIKTQSKDNPYWNPKKGVYRLECRLKDIKQLKTTESELLIILNRQNLPYTIYSRALLMNDIDNKIAHSLFNSLAISFIMIFLTILILTKSIKNTLISLVANLIPLSSAGLIMFLLAQDFNILSAVIIVISLGVMVDDTIHVVYRKLILKEPSYSDLIYSVTITSLILSLGFLSFIVSDFIPTKTFGIVSSIILFVTFFADITILPLMLDYFKKKID